MNVLSALTATYPGEGEAEAQRQATWPEVVDPS